MNDNGSLVSRGSEWRMWDLHVHTPMSIVQYYGGDTEEAWEKYIVDLENLPPRYKAIGVNDYIFIDGYKKILDFKAKGRLKNLELILPVVELRIDKFSSVGDEAWKKVNFHVIFSNDIDLESIQIQFLYAITSKATVFQSGESIQGVVTRQYLETLGRQIKEQSDRELSESLIKIGFNNVTFDYEKVKEALRNTCFKGKHLTAVGKSEWDRMRWDGSAAIKKTIVNEADFLFHSLEKPDDYEKHVKSLKEKNVNDRLLDCSDAHDFSTSSRKDRIGNSFTWLKADLSFDGLKQVANDSSRVYVGTTPPLLQRYFSAKGKFIDQVQIDKVEGSTLSEVWFEDFALPLNPSMVAIIGNKGNGKSALAESIGLVGDTQNSEYFTFLSPKKFRNRKSINRSENFIAKLTWADGRVDQKVLNEEPDILSYEKVKFIPQGFLEKLCNDDPQAFESELRKVIYSHLPVSDRLGKSTLDELIEFQSEVSTNDIATIVGEISELNTEISRLEEKNTIDYRKALDEKLKEKTRELEIHDSGKPIPINPPDDPEVVEANKATTERIEVLRTELDTLSKRVEELEGSEKNLKLKIVSLQKAVGIIEAFGRYHAQIRTDLENLLGKYGLDSSSFISVSTTTTAIQQIVEETQAKIDGIRSELGATEHDGLQMRRAEIANTVSELSSQLDAPSRAFHDYLVALDTWQTRRNDISGNVEAENTVAFFTEQVRYLNSELAIDLQKLREDRKNLVVELYNKKQDLLELYKTLFRPVTDFIAKYRDALEDYSIGLSVEFKVRNFQERFLDFINLGTRGSFSGNPAGIERVSGLISNTDFSSREGVLHFLESIDESLHIDKREEYQGDVREVSKQLRKGYEASNLYDYLFGLEYLVPEYKLRLGDKDLSDLSPGERGALLLIFYLTLDQNDIPLVIDQPEENLDNQSVYKILVKFMKEAKEKRQIIIVTHNPNLAVACGAEQIVHISIDKVTKNTVSIQSGSLESRQINDSVINVLEGTFPALTVRIDTYSVIERTRE